MKQSLKASYKGSYEIFQYYWNTYGSWKALLSSPYLHMAFFLLSLTHH